jgi:hypothetical protein
MDQTTARKLARQVGGIATTEARWRGRWGSALDPWVVVAGGTILREVPCEPSDGR